MPMVRAEMPVGGLIGASARSPRNIEIRAKIPLQDFLVSANIPTGLSCAGLF